jgi:hypothetical protein
MIARPIIRWDEWRGAMDGRPTLWVKHLFCRRGRHVDLHKMVGPDDPGCFHTHPAYAIRIILWGGYLEELEGGRVVIWKPGYIGLVAPELSHRIARVYRQSSYSLWIRFRKRAKVYLRGDGWQRQQQTFRAPNTEIAASQSGG